MIKQTRMGFLFILGFVRLWGAETLILDCTGKGLPALSRTVKDLERMGSRVVVKQFYEPFELDCYTHIFLILPSEFIQHVHDNSSVADTIQKIKKWLDAGHSLAIILPDLCYQAYDQTKELLSLFVKEIDPLVDEYIKFKTFASSEYTTLLPKRKTTRISYRKPRYHAHEIVAAHLPLKKTWLQKNKFAPCGVYVKSNSISVLIMKYAHLFAQEINEDFRMNPFDNKGKRKFNKTRKQALRDFFQLTRADLHKRGESRFMCGWIALDGYDEYLEKKIDYIFKAHLNVIWIEMQPEVYYSKNGFKKQEKEIFLAKLARFLEALYQRANMLQQPVPKILAGFNITSNFKQASVQNPVTTFYGETLFHIPSCIDKNVWHQEVIEVFNQFFEDWQRITPIPLSGIFLDFEMYHAQQEATEYSNLLDFSSYALTQFYRQNQSVLFQVEYQEQLDYIVKNGMIPLYIDFIKQEACTIGTEIKAAVQKKIPDALIGVYIPQLPHEAFYLGMCAGLSSQTSPIFLATFNSEYSRYKNFLQNNGIFCYHSAPLMLSKCTKQEDVRLIDDIFRHHDGVWFNRFSRFGSPYNKKSWWAIESTPFDHDSIIATLADHLKYVSCPL